MSETSERDYELAEMRAAQERDSAIARSRAALAGHGSAECIDCDNEIDPLRRKLMPSAVRCTHCQTRYEFGGPR